MNLKKRAEKIGLILDEIYPDPPIPLYHTNGYTLLVAVMLSAQTTDARVNIVTPPLFEIAPSAKEMIKLSEEEILEYIRTVGLAPTKARNIVGLSQIIVDEFNGDIPNTLNDLKKLPGVGQKTASVVMSQWFGIPAFPVDTHIHRLAKRWGLTSEKSTVKKTEEDLKDVFPKSTWNRRHLQIIYYGREFCPARSHKIETCKICSLITSGEL